MQTKLKLILYITVPVIFVISVFVGIIYYQKQQSPFPINSSKSATLAIDQLIDALEKKDKLRALSLLAKKNSSDNGELVVAIATDITTDKEMSRDIIKWLRSRRYIGKYHFNTQTYYEFEVTKPSFGTTSTLRVHQLNPEDGVYSDEGVEM